MCSCSYQDEYNISDQEPSHIVEYLSNHVKKLPCLIICDTENRDGASSGSGEHSDEMHVVDDYFPVGLVIRLEILIVNKIGQDEGLATKIKIVDIVIKVLSPLDGHLANLDQKSENGVDPKRYFISIIGLTFHYKVSQHQKHEDDAHSLISIDIVFNSGPLIIN